MTQVADRAATPRSAASLDADTRVARIYESEVGRLIALGQLLTGDTSAAEDLAQDIFLDLLTELRADADYLHGPPWAWLRVAMVHRAANRLRLATREVGRLMRIYEEPEVDKAWSETTIDYQRALPKLPPRMRACAVLHFSEDMTQEQIAELLGCGVATVETQIRRARARLAELMAEDEDGSSPPTERG